MSLSMRARVWLGLAICLIVLALLVVPPTIRQARLTAEAYLFSYPPVIMELTKRAQAAKGMQANTFTHIRYFPDASFRDVVAPNADTLYSLGSLDLRSEPVVLHIPDTGGHYYIMPLMDAWTNVFASPGTRTIGSESKNYLISGPSWAGEVPMGVEQIKAPTNMVWLVGRIKSSGVSDYAQINALQDRFMLTPLSQWTKSPSPVPLPPMTLDMPALTALPPDQQLEAWSLDSFFGTFCQLLKSNPAREADRPMLDRMKNAGLLTDSCEVKLSNFQRLGASIGFRKVVKELSNPLFFINKQPRTNGWTISYDLGEYGTSYDRRAVVAKIGLGALGPKDSIYPRAVVDSEGRPFDGTHRYRLHFASGKLPPVNGFWSLTLYDKEHFFTPNAIQRFAIGDRDALKLNEDGSLDLFIQSQPPSGELAANWLPAPTGVFELYLRMYWPKAAVLEQQWVLPAVERLD